MDVPGFDVVGDGGLFTTADDMAKWARNFDDHTVGGDEVAARVLTRGRLTSGDSIPYAFGLSHGVYRGQPIIEHGGAYGGYRTQLLRFPAQHFAVVTLCNAGTANAGRLSQSVADVYLGDRLTPVTAAAASATASPVRLSREQLTRYAGAYWDGKNETLRRIEMRDSTLAIAGTPFVLVPLSETTFRVSMVDFTLAFAAGHDGSVVLEETGPSGDKATYRRLPAPKIDARTLAEFAGDYVSDELDVTWRIEPRGGNLVIRLSGVPDVTLQPAFTDTFSSPAGVVRFVRSNGKVTGLVVGAGRVTGFSFRRASRD